MKKYLSLLFVIVFYTNCYPKPASVEMIEIPKGDFLRGIENGEDNPLARVSINQFKISKNEVTFDKYMEFLNDVGDVRWDRDQAYQQIGITDEEEIQKDFPAWYVAYFDALMFCNWLSEKDGFQPVYDLTLSKSKLGYKDYIVEWDFNANGYRLPTEAEWEYAARAGGQDESVLAVDISLLGTIAWFSNTSGGVLHPVGQLQPNKWGIYDMLGNVSEWCWDYYQPEYYKVAPLENPIGPEKGYWRYADTEPERTRVLRGGNFNSPLKYVNAAARGMEHPGARGITGIRLAQSIE